MEKKPKSVSIDIFLTVGTGARLNNLMPCKLMRWQILKWKCACGSMAGRSFVKNMEAASLENGKRTTLGVRSSGSATKSEVIRQCH